MIYKVLIGTVIVEEIHITIAAVVVQEVLVVLKVPKVPKVR
jgi:hypothetical protein